MLMDRNHSTEALNISVMLQLQSLSSLSDTDQIGTELEPIIYSSTGTDQVKTTEVYWLFHN